MNQILLTDNDNSKKKKNNKTINKINSNTNSNDIKKIIMFFSIVILVFGIAIGGVYGYKLFNNKEQQVVISEPKLALQKAEEGAESVTIIAESEIGISKIIYKWNEEQEEIKELNGRTKQEEIIEIPYGENKLTVKIIDQNGKEKETTETFYREDEEQKPLIETSIVEDGKLKIVATSQSAMQYIEYRWNEEENIKIEAENEEDTSIETIIDVKRGKNIITIVATDINNNKEAVEKTFNGVNRPEITVNKKQNKLYMKMTHDIGFKSIEFYVNGTTYMYDENFSGYDAEKKEIEYYFDLKEGENIVIIKAISTEETEAIYKGKCNYVKE